MNCQYCDFPINSEEIIKINIPLSICHKCGATYQQEIIGRYSHDVIYGNGQRTHFYAIVPYKCPNCNVEFKGHEFYCGFNNNTNREQLETVALETHHRMKLHEFPMIG